MRRIERMDSRRGFYGPWFQSRQGQIIGLASAREQMRDGLAVTLFSRNFPLPEYEGIRVEPGRPTIQPLENCIFVGRTTPLVEQGARMPAGSSRPLTLGAEKIGERLDKLYNECCFRFAGRGNRRLANDVTHQVYNSSRDSESHREVDYGVIRRLFRSAAENTITGEGNHRLGTLAAAMVATSSIHLDAIWNAVGQIEDFDESKPLEILVRGTFQPGQRQDVYSADSINAVPILLVYNRRWAFDMLDGHVWFDQLPWDLHLRVHGEDDPVEVGRKAGDDPVPRLELQADLSGFDRPFQRLCRKVLVSACAGRKPPAEEEVTRVLKRLTREADEIQLSLVQAPMYGAIRSISLPQNPSAIRRGRKRFLVHLAIARLFGRGFHCVEPGIREHFPGFKRGRAKRAFVQQFIGYVPGKMREGLEPVFGEKRKPKNFLQIDYDRPVKIYYLRLDRAALVIKLRLSV